MNDTTCNHGDTKLVIIVFCHKLLSKIYVQIYLLRQLCVCVSVICVHAFFVPIEQVCRSVL